MTISRTYALVTILALVGAVLNALSAAVWASKPNPWWPLVAGDVVLVVISVVTAVLAFRCHRAARREDNGN